VGDYAGLLDGLQEPGYQGLGLKPLPLIGEAGYGDVAEFRRQLNQRKRQRVR
jgi:hypothetical protein